MTTHAEQNKKNIAKEIDLEKVIKSKNPKLLKIVPGFVINYLKRVIHQDAINEFLLKHGDKYDIDFVNKALEEFDVKIEVKGKENLPLRGGCILASNHPLGGLDALALMSTVSTIRDDFKFLVNDILLNIENIKSLFIPINKHGRNSAQHLGGIEHIYASEEAVLIFPAGLVSRRQTGGIKDLDWKKSFITKAKKHQRNIIPVYIDGKNSNFFYRLALWRKRLGIKSNIEMLYLVDEMYKQKNKTITLIFGTPIPFTVFDKKHTDYYWAEKVKEHVYALAEGKQHFSF